MGRAGPSHEVQAQLLREEVVVDWDELERRSLLLPRMPDHDPDTSDSDEDLAEVVFGNRC